MIKIEVQSTRAVIRYQAPLTVGLRGAKAQFTFGQDWDNLTKTAVFRQGDKTVAVANIGQEVTIPWEVLEIPGVPVQIGVHGIDSTGNIAIPTVWAETQPVRPGTDPEGDPSAEPTPGLWEQMQGKLGSLEQLDTSDQSSLVAAVNEANRAVFAVTVSGTEGNYSADCSMTDLLEAWKAGKTLLCLWKEHSQWMSVCRAFVNETGASTFDFSTVWGNQVYFIRMKGTTGTIAVSSTSRTGLATETSKLPNPEKLTFIGAATAEYDGSEEVVVGIPTKVSQLENDSGFMTKAPVTSVNGMNGAVKLPVPLRVTIEELPNGVIQSDPPYEELAEFRSEGHLLYCQHGSLELPLAAVTPHLYIFSCVQGGKVHTVMVGSSSVTVTATALASGGSGSGVDGITPHIGDNGNWFIGDTDTGMPSRGEDAPQEAVLYTPQELTDEQKAQARENIGIDDFPTGDGCGYSKWVEVANMTTEEDLGELIVNIDKDGNSFEFDEIQCAFKFVGTEQNTKEDKVEYRALYGSTSNRGSAVLLGYGQRMTGGISHYVISEITPTGFATHHSVNGNNTAIDTPPRKISGIRLWPCSEYIAAGTSIVIYGRNREG